MLNTGSFLMDFSSNRVQVYREEFGQKSVFRPKSPFNIVFWRHFGFLISSGGGVDNGAFVAKHWPTGADHA